MSSISSEARAAHPLEWLLGGLAAVACLWAALIWLTAGVACVLAGNGWPDLSLDGLATAATRVPAHLDDPRLAWRREERSRLPGAPGMYGAGVLVLFGLGLLGGIALAHVGSRRPDRAVTAAWASTRDLRRLLRRSHRRGRVTLGRRGPWLVCAEPLHSAIVVGPTQTGKTTGLAVPAILEWDGPVLATSVKTDLLRDTIDVRRSRGRVQLFDPAGSTGMSSSSWTPLSGCTTWSGARQTAAWLAEGAAPSKRSLADGDFWYSAASKLLAPLLFAAALERKTMADVVRWIDLRQELEVRDILRKRKVQSAIDALEASISRDDRQASSIYTTAETILEAYADPGVLSHSRAADVRVADLFDGGQRTLYLSATVREQRRLRPVFVALIESVLEEAYRRSARTGRPLDPPLLVVLDEAANIAPLADLDVIAATGAGHGVQLVTVLQDLAQAHDRWGSDRADTIVNNHRARIIAGGSADARTLEYASRLLGDTEVVQESSTSGESGRRSETTSAAYRPLAPGHSIREAKPGSCLLLYGTLPPAWIRFRPWYRERSLLRQREASLPRRFDMSRWR